MPGVWHISYWTQFISICLTLTFYYSVFKFVKVKKYRTVFIANFGLLPLILQAYGIPSQTLIHLLRILLNHYYSYLLVISFAFIVITWIQNKIVKPILFLLVIFTYVNLYGFVKIDINTYKEALSVRNNYSYTCRLNQDISFNFLNSNCKNSEVKICQDSPHLGRLNYVENITNANLMYEMYSQKQKLSNGNMIVNLLLLKSVSNL